MSAIQQLKSMLPGFEIDEGELRTFECNECESTFQSAEPIDRAQCPDCLSRDVTVE